MNNLRKIREEKHIELEYIAEQTGIPMDVLKAFESGEKRMDIESGKKIAEVLNCTLKELMGDDYYECLKEDIAGLREMIEPIRQMRLRAYGFNCTLVDMYDVIYDFEGRLEAGLMYDEELDIEFMTKWNKLVAGSLETLKYSREIRFEPDLFDLRAMHLNEYAPDPLSEYKRMEALKKFSEETGEEADLELYELIVKKEPGAPSKLSETYGSIDGLNNGIYGDPKEMITIADSYLQEYFAGHTHLNYNSAYVVLEIERYNAVYNDVTLSCAGLPAEIELLCIRAEDQLKVDFPHKFKD